MEGRYLDKLLPGIARPRPDIPGCPCRWSCVHPAILASRPCRAWVTVSTTLCSAV